MKKISSKLVKFQAPQCPHCGQYHYPYFWYPSRRTCR